MKILVVHNFFTVVPFFPPRLRQIIWSTKLSRWVNYKIWKKQIHLFLWDTNVKQTFIAINTNASEYCLIVYFHFRIHYIPCECRQVQDQSKIFIHQTTRLYFHYPDFWNQEKSSWIESFLKNNGDEPIIKYS